MVIHRYDTSQEWPREVLSNEEVIEDQRDWKIFVTSNEWWSNWYNFGSRNIYFWATLPDVKKLDRCARCASNLL